MAANGSTRSYKVSEWTSEDTGGSFQLVSPGDQILIQEVPGGAEVEHVPGDPNQPANGCETFKNLLPPHSTWQHVNIPHGGPGGIPSTNVYTALVDAVESGSGSHGPSRITIITEGIQQGKLLVGIIKGYGHIPSAHSGQWR